MKQILPLLFCCLFITINTAQALAPQWQWAKGIGGTHNDQLLGTNNTLQVDSAGNSYAIVTSISSSLTIGATSYPNPGGSGSNANIAYFVKYSPQGAVSWVKKFPRFPASAGGQAMIPTSMFTTPEGFSYLMFYFRDSIRLEGVLFVDTSIQNINSGTNYCIARYDPNGNVQYIRAHQCSSSGFSEIKQFYGNKMLAYGMAQAQGDTLDGHPIGRGHFVAVMDSMGYVQRVRNIGYDSLGVSFLTGTAIAASNRSVFISLSVLYHPVIKPSDLPIGDLALYSDPNYKGVGKNLLIKLDSTLTFEWFKATTKNVGGIYTALTADKHDNVYLLGATSSKPQLDTIAIDTTLIIMPYLPPFGVYGYHNIIKIDGQGALQWVVSMPDIGGGPISSMCTDHLENAYAFGRYGGRLITGTDTLQESGNLFVVKISKNGTIIWSQTTKRADGRAESAGIATDAYGNIFVNGMYSDPNSRITFGNDSLLCRTPVPNYPLAPDVFTARLGSCNPSIPIITAAAPLQWCGTDSVTLTAPAAAQYLWSNGDTTQSIVAHSSGNFSVFAIDSPSGCYAKSAVQQVSANAIPTAQLSAVASTTTEGNGLAIATPSGGTAPYSFAWNTTPLQSDDTATGLAPGKYSVTITDANGCEAQDSVQVLANIPSAISPLPSGAVSIHIYPNPSAYGNVTINLSNSDSPGEITLYDNQGKQVWNQTIHQGKNECRFNLSAGFYYIKMLVAGVEKYDKLMIAE